MTFGPRLKDINPASCGSVAASSTEIPVGETCFTLVEKKYPGLKDGTWWEVDETVCIGDIDPSSDVHEWLMFRGPSNMIVRIETYKVAR